VTQTFAKNSNHVTSHDGKIIYYVVALDGVNEESIRNDAIIMRNKITSKKIF
jgi:hypothetical protein